VTNRYITEKEKAGHKRRVESYRARLELLGIKPRQVLLTDPEVSCIKQIVACWRGEKCTFSDDERAAADTLNPDKMNGVAGEHLFGVEP
jgi:hypothetical protein